MLKLLLTEDDGGLYAETADHTFAEDLTDDPRCKALVTAVMNGKSVAEFEADEAAQQIKATEVRAGAEASDDLYLQKVAAPDVPHGDRQLPRGVKLGYSDWSVLFPSGYAFCLISSMGKYEAKVADEGGLHELPERMVQATFNYCQSADAARMLLVAEQRVFEIDLATRALRVLYEAKRSIKCAGYAGDGVYVLDSKELCYLPHEAGEGALKPAWSLPRGSDVKGMEATGGPLVLIEPDNSHGRFVCATLDAEGLHHHARLDLEQALTRVWYHRGPDDEQVRVFSMDSWTDADATFYELHNVGVTGRGEPASQVLPDKAAVDALPLTAIIE